MIVFALVLLVASEPPAERRVALGVEVGVGAQTTPFRGIVLHVRPTAVVALDDGWAVRLETALESVENVTVPLTSIVAHTSLVRSARFGDTELTLGGGVASGLFLAPAEGGPPLPLPMLGATGLASAVIWFGDVGVTGSARLTVGALPFYTPALLAPAGGLGVSWRI